jgi:Tol biopolymer transport system component
MGLVRGAWPDISPDGINVAFVPVNEDGAANSQLKVISLISGQVQEFKSLSGYGASKPRWSNDGSRIAFETADNDIGILDPLTGDWRNLTTALDLGSSSGGIDFDSWVFGDKSILFHSLHTLYEVGVDGSLMSKRPIDHFGISSATRFSLSPSRKLLLFDQTIDSEERPLNGVISVLDTSANKLVMVTPDTIEGRTPRWISSDRDILFTCLKRFNNQNPGICKIAVDGSNLSTLATSADFASYSVTR